MEHPATPISRPPKESIKPNPPNFKHPQTSPGVEDAANTGSITSAAESGIQIQCATLKADPALPIGLSEVGPGYDDAGLPDDITVTTSEAPVFSIESNSNTGETIATEETDYQADTRVDLDGAKAVLTDSDGQNKASLLGVGQTSQQVVREDNTTLAEQVAQAAGDPPLPHPAKRPAYLMEVGDQFPNLIRAMDAVRNRDHQSPILGSSNFTEEPYSTTALVRSGDSDYGPPDLSSNLVSVATVESILVAMLKSGRLHAGPIRRSSRGCSTQDQSDTQDDLKIRVGVGVGSAMKLRRWSKKRPLRWYFDDESFPSDVDAAFVKQQLDRAFKCWTEPGFGLEVRETRFKDDATFFVRWSEDNDEDTRRDLAIAFFPGASRHHSNIFIFDKALRGDLRAFLFGVLCHELGHVWGLRHEFDERTAGLLGDRNPASVMNYHNKDMANLMVHPADLEGLRAFYAFKGKHLSVLVDGQMKLVEIIDVNPREQQPIPLSSRHRKRLGPGDRHGSTWPTGSW